MSEFFKKHGDTLVTVATVIGAFGVLVAIFDQRFDAQEKLINQRFDAQDKYINQRFDAQDRYIDQRFDAVDQRFDAQDRRLDRLENDVAELRTLVVGISERVSRNDGQIDVIRQQLQIADAPVP